MASARKITIEFLGNNRDLDNALDSTAKRSSRFGDSLKKAGKVAALGLAAGAVVAGKALFDMTKGAIEDEAAQKRLANVLKGSANATDAQVASTEDWITAQGKAFGVTDDDLRPALARLATATGDVGKAQDLATLAMDISAGSGKSLKSVTDALAKAQGGSVTGLAKLGVATKNAAGETLSLDQIQAKLAKNYKGAAAAGADTLSGKMQRLKVALSEAGETIGAKLIPVVTKMADWFVQKALPALQKFGHFLSEVIPPIFAKVKAVIQSFLGGSEGKFSETFAAIKGIVKDAVSIIQSLWKRFGKTITQYLASSMKNCKQVLGGAFKVIQGIFKTVSALLKGDWKGVWDGIKMILKGALQIIIGIIKQAFNYIKTAFKLLGSALKGIFSGIWNGLKDLAMKGMDKVVDVIKGVPGKIADLFGKFRDVGKGLIEKLFEGIGAVGSFAADFAGQIWNAIKAVVNAGIDSLNNLLEFDLKVHGIGIHVNAPDLPHLMAKGGIVRARPGGTLARIGEAGYDEAVIPLGGPNAPKFGMGGNTIINVYGPADTAAAGRLFEQILIKHVRTTGRPLQVRTLGA